MCGDGYSTAPTVDSGDLIAVIHPSDVFAGGRLRLWNRSAGGETVSQLSVPGVGGEGAESVVNVRIHKFGQPLSSSSNPVVHEFFILSSECDDAAGPSTAGTRLNLGVGGDGIVGRTVSIVDSRRQILGEGVIGWG